MINFPDRWLVGAMGAGYYYQRHFFNEADPHGVGWDDSDEGIMELLLAGRCCYNPGLDQLKVDPDEILRMTEPEGSA